MAIKKRTSQRKLGRDGKYRGIFKREIRSVDSEDNPAEVIKGLSEIALRSSFDPGERLEYIEEFFVSIIEDHGIEVKKPYSYQDAYPVGDESEGTIAALVASRIESGSPGLEPVGLAGDILTYCYLLRGHIKDKNISEITRWSMQLQRKIDQYSFAQWELPARIGEAVSIGGEKGGRDKAKLQALEIEKRNKNIIKGFNKGIPTSVIAKQESLNIRTVQKVVKPFRNK